MTPSDLGRDRAGAATAGWLLVCLGCFAAGFLIAALAHSPVLTITALAVALAAMNGYSKAYSP